MTCTEPSPRLIERKKRSQHVVALNKDAGIFFPYHRCPRRGYVLEVRVNGSGPVRDAFGSRHTRAVGAAVEMAAGLDAVPDHLDVAVLAGGGEGVDRALETVEGVRVPIGRAYLKSFVVVVAADFALGHSFAPSLRFCLSRIIPPVSESQSVARPLPETGHD